ncbi:MAG: DUF2089 domain-containing protein [Anaerolineales bacterium]|nr:DUF2089 domain-containing protein [Anaerolineales bacterium]
MNTLPTTCPLCGGAITVTRLYCPDCNSTIEGRFTEHPFAQLTPDQLRFVETFVRCEGKITRMENELGLSYPTIRNRLHEVIRALGYEPGQGEEPEGLGEAERQDILAALEAGEISADKALGLLRERGG